MSDINDVFGNEESGFEAVFGGSFPGDYNDLSNKPSIESQELVGNKTAEDLGLAKITDIPTVPTQLSQLEDDAEHRTVTDEEKSGWNSKAGIEDIEDEINALGIETTAPTGSDCVCISDVDLPTKDLYTSITLTLSSNRKSGTPSPTNPCDYYSYDKMVFRQYYRGNDSVSLSIGMANSTAGDTEPLIVYERIAISSNGEVVENPSYNTYAFPLVKNANYLLFGGQYDSYQNAFLGDSMPEVGASVTVLSLDNYSGTKINSGNKKFLFYSWGSFTSTGIPIIPVDGFTSASSSPWYCPVFYNDFSLSCSVQNNQHSYPIKITGGSYKITPTSRGINGQIGLYYELWKMGILESSDENGIFDLQFEDKLSINGASGVACNKLKSITSGDANYSIRRINKTTVRLHISDCANMTDQEVKDFLLNGSYMMWFTPIIEESEDLVVAIEDHITFEGIGYYCCGNDKSSSSVRVVYIKSADKLIETIPKKANSSEVVPMPDKPNTNGTYTLKMTKQGSNITYTWVRDT